MKNKPNLLSKPKSFGKIWCTPDIQSLQIEMFTRWISWPFFIIGARGERKEISSDQCKRTVPYSVLHLDKPRCTAQTFYQNQNQYQNALIKISWAETWCKNYIKLVKVEKTSSNCDKYMNLVQIFPVSHIFVQNWRRYSKILRRWWLHDHSF